MTVEDRIGVLLQHGTLVKTGGLGPEVNILMHDNEMANELFELLEGLATRGQRRAFAIEDINEKLAPTQEVWNDARD